MSGERLLKSIDGFPKSYALIPDGPSDTAIVFVHGFGGSPTGTWLNFHGLSEEYANKYTWWKDATLFFYAYDSIRKAIHYNAVRLQSFLEDNLRDKCHSDGLWKSIVLVGHSEGAVVIRRMILNKVEFLEKRGRERQLDGKELRDWVEISANHDTVLKGSVRLFAPACAGTNFSGVLGFVNGLSNLFSAIAASSLVRNELVQGSPILRGLLTCSPLSAQS